jgi:hypothetical protein
VLAACRELLAPKSSPKARETRRLGEVVTARLCGGAADGSNQAVFVPFSGWHHNGVCAWAVFDGLPHLIER